MNYPLSTVLLLDLRSLFFIIVSIFIQSFKMHIIYMVNVFLSFYLDLLCFYISPFLVAYSWIFFFQSVSLCFLIRAFCQFQFNVPFK